MKIGTGYRAAVCTPGATVERPSTETVKGASWPLFDPGSDWSIEARHIRPMPDLGSVPGYPGIVCQIYRVENGKLFVEVFPVDVVLNDHEPAFLLFVSTDSEERGHERFPRSPEAT